MPIPPPRPSNYSALDHPNASSARAPGLRSATTVRTAAHPVTGQVLAGSLLELVRNGPVRPPTWLSCEI